MFFDAPKVRTIRQFLFRDLSTNRLVGEDFLWAYYEIILPVFKIQGLTCAYNRFMKLNWSCEQLLYETKPEGPAFVPINCDILLAVIKGCLNFCVELSLTQHNCDLISFGR